MNATLHITHLRAQAALLNAQADELEVVAKGDAAELDRLSRYLEGCLLGGREIDAGLATFRAAAGEFVPVPDGPLPTLTPLKNAVRISVPLRIQIGPSGTLVCEREHGLVVDSVPASGAPVGEFIRAHLNLDDVDVGGCGRLLGLLSNGQPLVIGVVPPPVGKEGAK